MRLLAMVLAGAGLALGAAAQEWQFHLSETVLRPGGPTATVVTASIDPGPDAFAVLGANFAVHASEAGWTGDQRALLLFPGQNPGVVSGSSVVGISIGQISTSFEPDPGRIEVWRATFEVSDFSSSREIVLETETSRFEVWLEAPVFGVGPREPRIPVEGRVVIQVIPAPGVFALLGLGALAAPRRRRVSR